MAQYTIELRTILKSKDIFKSINYDLYNNDLKPIFEDKFIKRFYFREIGVETVSRFLINLEQTLNEIMPYYKQLYDTTLLKYDILNNNEVIEEVTREIIKADKRLILGTNTSTGMSFDTPITSTNNYRSKPSFINEGVDKVDTKNQSEGNTTENFTRKFKNNQSNISKQDLIIKQRELIINIDKMILDDLEVLFMQVF